MLTVDDTSVTVSWNDLIIPDFSIDYYTVVYTRLSQQQNEEMSTSPATSGVGIDLDTTAIYQFQVFATVTVDGRTVDGERSNPVYFTRPRKKMCTYMCLFVQVNEKICNLESEYRDCIKSRRDKIGITSHIMMHQVLYNVHVTLFIGKLHNI